jgi:uncharacterized membrane protein
MIPQNTARKECVNMSVSRPGHFGDIKFPVTASVLLSLVVILAAWIYATHPEWHPTMEFLSLGFVMIATVLSAYYIGQELQITINQRAEALRSERISRSFVYIDAWDHPYLSKTKQIVRDLIKSMHSGKNDAQWIIDEIEKEKDKESSVWDILNFFEGFSLAINQGIADDETLRRCFRGTLIDNYLTFEGLIKQKRAVRNRPQLYAELEVVAKAWNR